MKRYWIAMLVFVLYVALVVAAGFLLHFEGTKLLLFCLILVLIGAVALALILWYLKSIRPAENTIEAASSIDSGNLDALLRDANQRLKQSTKGGAKSLAQMPVIYIVGDENAAKTQTVLQSGMDPELIAGQIYRDQNLVPTQLVNIWYTGTAALVEAGGKLLRDPGLWQRLVRLTQPGKIGTALSKSALQPTRAAVLCVSIERIMAPNTSEQIRALAQAMNERLRQLSQTLGISLPVYVLFTKLDTMGPFADYVGALTEDEVKSPVGSLLERLDSGAGLYAERATTLVGARFDEVVFSLAEFRMAVLSRGGQPEALAKAYEFPRDLRKLRSGIVDFLVEAARPSQLGVNPFLRGFFFSGMRAHIVDDVSAVQPQPQQQQAPMQDAGATQIFSLASLQQQIAAAPAPRSGGSRKVAQWVFLPHLLSRLVLGDKTALESSRASTKVSGVKRVLWAMLGGVISAYLVLLTISFFNNKALEDRIVAATKQPVTPLTETSFASLPDLQNLDQIRVALIQLDGYRRDGAPLMYRWGLYRGDALYGAACHVYGQRFRSLLLAQTQANIMVKLASMQSPPSPEADYNSTYKPLKAYLITTANPDKSTSDFLPAVLKDEWQGSRTPQPEVAQLAQSQFELYASLLAQPQSCVAAIGGAPDMPTVEHAREYLGHFGGFQHVYQSMLAAANHRFPAIRFNEKFPGSAHYLVDSYEVPGAFSKGGFGFMQDAIQHPDPYFSGEEWVLGKQSTTTVDRATLPGQLQKQYSGDFLTMWRTFLNRATFVPFQNWQDAAGKLTVLDGNSSPLLELFSVVSLNTAVSAPELAGAFQAPQAVVPPANGENHYSAPANQGYIQALQGLEQAIKSLSLSPVPNDPMAAAPVNQAAGAADQAAEAVRGTFNPDSAGRMDAASFALLEAPIKSANALAAKAPAAAAGGGAKTFCAQMAPMMTKFPFNPLGTVEATPDEVAQIFQPQQGALAQFYAQTLNKLLVLQGTQYVAVPGSALSINPAFLSFFNAAEKFSSTIYPAGGTQPMLNFSLTQVKTPGVPDAVLNIDGQQIATAGQSAHFVWTSTPSSKITLTSEQNTAPPMVGPWSVFHLAYSATHPAPNRLEYSFQFNGHTNQVVRFEAAGPAAELLDPKFMSRLHCVATVAH